MKSLVFPKWGARAAAGVALFCVAASAYADIKFVAEVTVKGAPTATKANLPDKSVTTSYYKGEKQRIETEKPGGKTVTISDLATGTTYTLNPAKKTYTVFKLSDIEAMTADNPIMQMLKIETQTTITPGTATKSIAGKNAKQYTYNTSFKMSLEGGDDQIAAFAQMMPTITIKGEQWTTEDVRFPVNYQKIAQTNMARSIPPMMAKGMSEMIEKMATIKGFPLSSVVTVSFILPKNAAPQAAASMPKEPIITTTEVKSISEENLDDSLFELPKDYTEVKTETPAGALPGAAPASAGKTGTN
ncbi:MAG: hypothetical protein SFU56_14655 [Capsulimonadales bacterium]|nr:hypothetical protein [Capsulimonadales bacterium]